jgi:hypothetical protein
VNRGIAEHVVGEPGFIRLQLAPGELEMLRQIVEKHWLAGLARAVPELVGDFRGRGMDRYHELTHLVDHVALWPKASRWLTHDEIDRFFELSIFTQLYAAFGRLGRVEACPIGGPLDRADVYWRLARPDQPSDVGPLHADGWFWELHGDPRPSHLQRVKIWIALYCEPGQAGLRVVPGTHRARIGYHAETRHGHTKPVMECDERELPIELVPTRPGDAIVFHDNLVHGGAVGGTRCRVSLEAAVLVAAGAWPEARAAVARLGGGGS